jgi:L-amino acid N-acyltransferase YncA
MRSNVKIRTATADDARQIAAIYAPYVLETWISFEEVPPSESEMRDRISNGLRTYPWLVADQDSTIEGYCFGSVHRSRSGYRWSPEVTVYVRRATHRRGIGVALYTRLLELLERQGFRAAFGGIALPNEPSIALHEKMGFKKLGVFETVGYKLGAWRDVGWWRRDLARLGDSPADPIPFSSLR